MVILNDFPGSAKFIGKPKIIQLILSEIIYLKVIFEIIPGVVPRLTRRGFDFRPKNGDWS